MDENGKLTLGSLFSGSGSFELGGMLAGITPASFFAIYPDEHPPGGKESLFPLRPARISPLP